MYLFINAEICTWKSLTSWKTKQETNNFRKRNVCVLMHFLRAAADVWSQIILNHRWVQSTETEGAGSLLGLLYHRALHIQILNKHILPPCPSRSLPCPWGTQYRTSYQLLVSFSLSIPANVRRKDDPTQTRSLISWKIMKWCPYTKSREFSDIPCWNQAKAGAPHWVIEHKTP